MAIEIEKPLAWSDETHVHDTEATRTSHYSEERLTATFSVFPNESHERVVVGWGSVKPIAVHAEALVKTLEALGYKVTKE